MRNYFIIVAAILVVTAASYSFAPKALRDSVFKWAGLGETSEVGKGQFRGTLEALFDSVPTENGESIELIMLKKPFGYTDSKGVDWDVPEGYLSNGASIPKMLWSVIGAPLSGPYLYAAVLHDYYCEQKSRPWQQVHEMFFEAAVNRGTDIELAKILYAGVLLAGPRWENPTATTFEPGLKKAQTLPLAGFSLLGGEAMAQETELPFEVAGKSKEQIFAELQKWIRREKPTKDEITRVLRAINEVTLKKSR